MLAIVLAAAVLAAPAPAVSRDSIAAIVRAEMARSHAPAVSIAVVRGDSVVFAGGFGQANVEWAGAATDRTVYELMSVGKQFTAAAVMRLVERGAVKLDGALGDLLPDAPAAWKAVTVRQLLAHTAGIPDYVHAPDFMKTLPLELTPKEIVDRVAGQPLTFPPGTNWGYSNTGYFLLGMIVEKVSAKPLAAFLHDELFAPLGMESTRMNDLKEIVPNRAAGYAWGRNALWNDLYVSPSQKWAAGAVVSNAQDLARWEAAVADGRLLRRESWQAMESPVALTNGAHTAYGMGNELDTDHGHRVAGHQGGAFGYDATVLRFPDDHLSVIALTNLRGGESRRLARRIATLWLPDLSDASRPATSDPDPAFTARFRSVLEGAAKGTVETSWFSAEGQAQVVPMIQRVGPRFVGSQGALQSLTLIDAQSAASGRTLTYRAEFANGAMTWVVQLDGEGKIAGMEPRD